MFSIGEIARLGAVSIRALRHYDEIGLLPAAEVDPVTGYRSSRSWSANGAGYGRADTDLGSSACPDTAAALTPGRAGGLDELRARADAGDKTAQVITACEPSATWMFLALSPKSAPVVPARFCLRSGSI